MQTHVQESWGPVGILGTDGAAPTTYSNLEPDTLVCLFCMAQEAGLASLSRMYGWAVSGCTHSGRSRNG